MADARRHRRYYPDRHGFTLVEMAVVLVIIGLLIMTVFPALTAVRSGSQRALTQGNLHNLMLATAAYVQANGCLPCPTPANVSGANFGHVRGDGNAAACNGCSVPEGIPPFASLGIPPSTAHDGWGNWITMRVDPALTVLPANKPGSVFIPPAAACLSSTATNPPGIDFTNGVCTAAQNGVSAKGLCSAGLSSANRVSIQNPGGSVEKAAVIFVSHGLHGYGSFIADGQAFISTGTGCRKAFPNSTLVAGNCSAQPSCAGACFSSDCFAQCNAAGTNNFYDAPTSDAYTDMLNYSDRNTLVAMLGNGSCQTAW